MNKYILGDENREDIVFAFEYAPTMDPKASLRKMREYLAKNTNCFEITSSNKR